ncbi:ImmA/IrrE family metallo-endopeptidase [Acetobacter thailandicus]|uniref:ImmA/IrrE family metallo-endopeptidase n=1 Tax=Acetobacter thailandicus TaxID=1502842 RepID=UPI001BABB54F|nr:ImmA/IrrE family metallo-endopeptidase [Acetobacter thailandicus]MBS1003511.1 ImmA/IrrE family metallo-endopeptidase [Acetobacter thailandicus]
MLPERVVVNKLVTHYKRNSEGRINFNEIIEGEGIVLKTMPNADLDGASGQFLEVGPTGSPTIYINTKKSLNHQRFTLAHELGHYFLRHGSRMRDTAEQLVKKDPVEMAANRFAAELLMPEDYVMECARNFLSVQDMAKKFKVSEQAINNRLKTLRLL